MVYLYRSDVVEKVQAQLAAARERQERMDEKEDSPEEIEAKVRALAELITSARHVVVYTGGLKC